MIRTIFIGAIVAILAGSTSYFIFTKTAHEPVRSIVSENAFDKKDTQELLIEPKPAHSPEPVSAVPTSTSNNAHKPTISHKPNGIVSPPTQQTVTHLQSTTTQKSLAPYNDNNSPSTVIWGSRDFAWSPNGTPPPCPEPLITHTPVDMRLVIGALWPGQVRGGYKAHGGFRFNNDGTDKITVRDPTGSHLIQASQYLENGEKQYFMVFSVPCGFVYRLDHLKTLSPKLAEIVKNLPYPKEGDSRTSYIIPPVWVNAGEIIATSVGITKNIFIDFGLYDVRKPNNIIPNPIWADLYTADKEFGHYGVCFFDYLPGNDGTVMRSLPTGKEGKISDYCLRLP